jgi:hypothetical protein
MKSRKRVLYQIWLNFSGMLGLTVSWREFTVPSKEQIAEFDDYKLGS